MVVQIVGGHKHWMCGVCGDGHGDECVCGACDGVMDGVGASAIHQAVPAGWAAAD